VVALEVVVADERAPEGEEGLVDVGAAVVATCEPAVVVQPGEGALDDPALGADAGAVHRGRLGGPALGDARLDPPSLELQAMLPAVIGTVGENSTRTELVVRAGRGDPVDQVDDLGHVVAIPGGDRARQRDAVAATDQVMFAALAASVDR
jgi:hypothetical protein